MRLLKKVKTMSKEGNRETIYFLPYVQTKNNHALLEQRIYRKFLDLSVLCNYEFTVGKELLSIGLSKMLLDQINVSEEEAFELAYKKFLYERNASRSRSISYNGDVKKKSRSGFPYSEGTFGILIAKRVWCKYHAESGIFENGI